MSSCVLPSDVKATRPSKVVHGETGLGSIHYKLRHHGHYLNLNLNLRNLLPAGAPGDEIDVNTFEMEDSAFHFASLLQFSTGELIWEDLPGGNGAGGNPQLMVHRTPFSDQASFHGLPENSQ